MRKEYGTDYTFRPGNPLPEIKRTDIVIDICVTIEQAKMNEGLADSDFQITFPPGTTYLDSRDGETYVVDPAGTVKKLVQEMRGHALPYDTMSKEEATRIERGRSAVKKFERSNQQTATVPGPSVGGGYTYGVIFLLTVFLLGWFVFRRFAR